MKYLLSQKFWSINRCLVLNVRAAASITYKLVERLYGVHFFVASFEKKQEQDKKGRGGVIEAEQGRGGWGGETEFLRSK